MRSSPKITVFLGVPPKSETDTNTTTASTSWTCGVCGYVNAGMPSELGGGSNPPTKCGLCGVAFSTSRSQSSLPPTRPATPAASASAPPLPASASQVACPACTFLNHRSLAECEICSTPLPNMNGVSPPLVTGAINSVLANPPPSTDAGLEILRLSFRQGCVKDAYRKLKSVLSIRGWESGVCVVVSTAFKGELTPVPATSESSKNRAA
jgi:ESCRT-II complex subunit VPS36